MPYENADRNGNLSYFLCLGNQDYDLHSIRIQLNPHLDCTKLLGKKFLEDMFCMRNKVGSRQLCQVTFLISFLHMLSSFSSWLCVSVTSSFVEAVEFILSLRALRARS